MSSSPLKGPAQNWLAGRLSFNSPQDIICAVVLRPCRSPSRIVIFGSDLAAVKRSAQASAQKLCSSSSLKKFGSSSSLKRLALAPLVD